MWYRAAVLADTGTSNFHRDVGLLQASSSAQLKQNGFGFGSSPRTHIEVEQTAGIFVGVSAVHWDAFSSNQVCLVFDLLKS